MSYTPPKGVYPPQFIGKKGGRPKGSLNGATAMRDLLWGFNHRNDKVPAPTAGADLWRKLAHYEPRAVMRFLLVLGYLKRSDVYGDDEDEDDYDDEDDAY